MIEHLANGELVLRLLEVFLFLGTVDRDNLQSIMLTIRVPTDFEDGAVAPVPRAMT